IHLPSNFVGLINAGVTCYMNAILQQLFMIEEICITVLQVRVGDIQSKPNIVNKAFCPDGYVFELLNSLKEIFYHLQKKPVVSFPPKMLKHERGPLAYVANGQKKDTNLFEHMTRMQDCHEFWLTLAEDIDKATDYICGIKPFE
ncbi:unnamed protein product, partial [Didymodactylos carnosus]